MTNVELIRTKDDDAVLDIRALMDAELDAANGGYAGPVEVSGGLPENEAGHTTMKPF
jgi:hypothetical protein